MLPHPANVERLANPYTEVNETGTVNAYDYVRRFVANSVVYYNGMRPFYFYTGHDTNRFMDVNPHPLGMADLVPQPQPDYLVQRKTQALPPEQWPLWDDYAWEIIYEDSFAVVYRRIEG